MTRQTVSINKACALCDVSRRTIYNWMERGRVEWIRTAGGARRLFVDTLWTTDRPEPRPDPPGAQPAADPGC